MLDGSSSISHQQSNERMPTPPLPRREGAVLVPEITSRARFRLTLLAPEIISRARNSCSCQQNNSAGRAASAAAVRARTQKIIFILFVYLVPETTVYIPGYGPAAAEAAHRAQVFAGAGREGYEFTGCIVIVITG